MTSTKADHQWEREEESPRYSDRFVAFDKEGLRIRWYYFPFANDKVRARSS